MSTPLTCGTMFSGGGGWDLGAMAAGYTPVWAIECESPIADCYEANIGQHVIRDFVQCVDPSELRRVDLLCASPVCKSFSTANPAGGEHEIDIVCARAVAHFLRVLSPPAFCLENVAAYAKSRSMDIIREALQDVYGWWDEAVHNAADYGVPQTRKRFIVRANGGAVAPLPKASRRIGWYQAIEDLIPTLPPSEFAPWQLERLPKAFTGNRMLPVNGAAAAALKVLKPAPTVTSDDNQMRLRAFIVEGTASGIDNKFSLPVRSESEPVFTIRGSNPTRAFLVEGDAAGDRCPTVLEEGEACFTLKAGQGGRVHRALLVGGDSRMTTVGESYPSPTVVGADRAMNGRAWLEYGRVVKMTSRALARFMSFPDSYALPKTNSLATTILGNAVPPLLGQAMIESVKTTQEAA